MKTVPGDLKKLSDLVGNEVVNNTKFNALKKKVNNLEKKKMKMLINSGLVTTTVLNTKISEVENKTRDNSKYITTQEFNKLTAEIFTARLK